MRPTLLVLVMTSPRVREGEEVLVIEGDPPAEVEVEVAELELEPAATAPLDEVLVDDVLEVVLGLAPAGVVLVSMLGVEIVLELPPP